jgi:transcriptional regulator with XRE-family HTH domain
VTANERPTWDGRDGTAGGAPFGAALAALAQERDVAHEALAREAGLSPDEFADVLAGKRRIGLSALACFAALLRLKPIEFLQRTQMLSLEAYAFGLDPLYFLPEGPIRYDARIYMREINPRHRVPESDMTRRNATLKAVGDDEILDARGKLEVEMAYLLRAAVQQTGGSL